MDLGESSIEIVECCEENVGIVAQSRRQDCDMVRSIDEALRLKMLEKGKVATTTCSMEVVSDQSNPLSPVQGLVDSGHDGEFCQVGGEECKTGNLEVRMEEYVQAGIECRDSGDWFIEQLILLRVTIDLPFTSSGTDWISACSDSKKDSSQTAI